MKLLRYLILSFFVVPFLQALAIEEQMLELDRIEVEGGVVLTGTIESVDPEYLVLLTDYAGSLMVDLKKVRQVSSPRRDQFTFPDSIIVLDLAGKAPQPTPAPVAKKAKKVDKPVDRGTPEDKRGWELEAGLDFSGRDGNTEKMDLTTTLEATLQRQFDRVDLYGRYSFGSNKGSTSSNEFVIGGRYTNFFYEGIGFFVREEIEIDRFEGLAYRSTTASGVSWKVRNLKDLKIEARSGLSYRYEDYRNDGEESFPGMDFGLDVNWKVNPWVRFKGSYTFLPSVQEMKEFIVEQDSGIDMPLDMSDRWRLRLGLSTKYNNSPDIGRDRLDTRYYARVIASWP